MITHAILLPWIFSVGFAWGRIFPAKAKALVNAKGTSSYGEQTARDVGERILADADKVWFDMKMVGGGMICQRRASLKSAGKPTLWITIEGDTDQ